ncbi:MAG: ATP phosphoribosyltransferase regulatory subunit [Tepidimonas taiwanensis]|nr:ATP phosphoribosyltransferase regulatory subunit [Tepidimonas taiwanensis]
MSKRAKLAVGQRFLAAFRDAGAAEVAPDILLPAETLLDLYGEDIRARAYVTADPIRGEMMLRPDFTVPVVQMHMQGGAEPARYCYLGEVFRKQDHGETRPEHPRDREYLQAGFEAFDHDATRADAEVFALFHRLLAGLNLRAVTGDMGLLRDAIDGLPMSAVRRAALKHHIWRPARFDRLLARFSAPGAPRDFPPTDAPWIGARDLDEMAGRLERLAKDAGEDALPPDWVVRLSRLFTIRGTLPEALAQLRALAGDMPAITGAVNRLAARIDAIAAHGIDPQGIAFDASHGRHEMEYYDGFTFSYRTEDPALPPVASGGRYDALTAVLGAANPRPIPAVGGIIRPGLVAELEGIC